MLGYAYAGVCFIPQRPVINNNWQEWASAFGTPQQVVLRCRIALAAASGQSDNAIATKLAANRHTVRLWRKRVAQEGLKSLWQIAPGRGRKPTYGPEKIQAIIDTTLQSKPKGRTNGAAAPWPSAWE